MKPTVILISGYKRSGKDFVGQKVLKRFLDLKLFPQVGLHSFAYPLKKIIQDTFEIDELILDHSKNNCLPVSIGKTEVTNMRKVLQRFGTEAMKPWFGEDVWVKLAIKDLKEDELYIFTDWRFETEVKMLKLIANVITLRVSDFNLIPDNHISEIALDNFNFDFEIDNSAKNNQIEVGISDFIDFFESKYVYMKNS